MAPVQAGGLAAVPDALHVRRFILHGDVRRILGLPVSLPTAFFFSNLDLFFFFAIQQIELFIQLSLHWTCSTALLLLGMMMSLNYRCITDYTILCQPLVLISLDGRS